MALAILSQRLIDSLTRRPDFFERMPEFSAVRQKRELVDRQGAGCRGCKKRTLQYDMFGTFMNILLSLSPPAMMRFKAYSGVDSLQCQWLNRSTGKYEIRTI